MATLNPTTKRAADYAVATSDAYSFNRYGSSAWMACYAMLFRRGYNAVEAEAIMRSKLARLGADGRKRADGHATSMDLARFLDSVDDAQLRGLVDDYVLGIFGPDDDEPNAAPVPNRFSIRLVWTRPRILHVVCSWCNGIITEGDRSRPSSHGICPSCVATFESGVTS